MSLPEAAIPVGSAPPAESREDAASPTSMGAGGLTGSGAVEDGARTGMARTGVEKPPSARATGTTRYRAGRQMAGRRLRAIVRTSLIGFSRITRRIAAALTA